MAAQISISLGRGMLMLTWGPLLISHEWCYPQVICISIYGGPGVDFGDGDNRVLWVDNLGKAEGVLQEFKGWLEDPNTQKVWHNYGFDRHVLYNEGINCRGFAGDTMHMARLWDSSRDKADASSSSSNGNGENGGGGNGNGESGTSTKGYALEALSKELVPFAAKMASMKDLFGRAKLRKDNTPGSIKEIPRVEELQESADTRNKWIKYSADDAIATWALFQRLERKLKMMEWRVDQGRGELKGDMLEFYRRYLVPFGEVLTDMERAGEW